MKGGYYIAKPWSSLFFFFYLSRVIYQGVSDLPWKEVAFRCCCQSVSWGAAVTGLFLFFLLSDIFYRRAVYIVHLDISDGE